MLLLLYYPLVYIALVSLHNIQLLHAVRLFSTLYIHPEDIQEEIQISPYVVPSLSVNPGGLVCAVSTDREKNTATIVLFDAPSG